MVGGLARRDGSSYCTQGNIDLVLTHLTNTILYTCFTPLRGWWYDSSFGDWGPTVSFT